MSAVSRFTTFEYLDPAGPLIAMKVELTWASTDPFAVELRIHRGRGRTTTWMVSRDLLADGLHFPSGLGDVRLAPEEEDPGALWLTLRSPEGRAEFLVSAHDLSVFLAETFAAVPTGGEITDEVSAAMDEWLAELVP